jgi:hypothetical protein
VSKTSGALGAPPRRANTPLDVDGPYPCVFLTRPANQCAIEVAEDRVQSRLIEPAVVDPAPKHRDSTYGLDRRGLLLASESGEDSQSKLLDGHVRRELFKKNASVPVV